MLTKNVHREPIPINSSLSHRSFTTLITKFNIYLSRICLVIKYLWNKFLDLIFCRSHDQKKYDIKKVDIGFPNELYFHIFQHLSNSDDRKNTALVCKNFSEIIRDQNFQKLKKLKQKFNYPEFCSLFEGKLTKYMKLMHEIDISTFSTPYNGLANSSRSFFNVEELFQKAKLPVSISKNTGHLIIRTTLTMQPVDHVGKHTETVIHTFSPDMQWDLYFEDGVDFYSCSISDLFNTVKDKDRIFYAPTNYNQIDNSYREMIASLFSKGEFERKFYLSSLTLNILKMHYNIACTLKCSIQTNQSPARDPHIISQEQSAWITLRSNCALGNDPILTPS